MFCELWQKWPKYQLRYYMLFQKSNRAILFILFLTGVKHSFYTVNRLRNQHYTCFLRTIVQLLQKILMLELLGWDRDIPHGRITWASSIPHERVCENIRIHHRRSCGIEKVHPRWWKFRPETRLAEFLVEISTTEGVLFQSHMTAYDGLFFSHTY